MGERMHDLHGGNIYHTEIRLDYSVNLNPLGTPQSVIDSAARSIAQITAYPDPDQTALTAALSERIQIPGEMIQFGNGAAELIDACVAAAAPRKLMLPEPSFSEYRRIAELSGCEIIPFVLRDEDDFCLRPEALAEALHASIDLLILCTPNNPNGLQIRPDGLEHILSRCLALNITVLLDESFIFLSDHPEYAADAALLDRYPNLYVLRSFTKSYAMPGLRLGYGMTFDCSLLERVGRRLQPWNISLPATAAGLAALGEAKHVSRAASVIRAERQYMISVLRECGLRVFPSECNYLLFQAAEDLGERLLEHGILIRDCSNYRGLGAGWFRTSVRTHEDNLQMAAALRDCLSGGQKG